jgi:hypothetical protein
MQLNPRSVVFLGALASALALHGTHAQAPGLWSAPQLPRGSEL